MWKKLLATFVVVLAVGLGAVFFLPGSARAQLAVGAQAPAFATQGALDGKPIRFELQQALRRGPVVLYFFPKAFTQGCTLETRAFAEMHDRFAAAGATVIGMSTDDLPTLQRFSKEECRGKFPVAVATPKIVDDYRVALVNARLPGNLTNRTSYVIGRNGRIAMVHSEMDYRDHVRLTLAAVEGMARPARR